MIVPRRRCVSGHSDEESCEAESPPLSHHWCDSEPTATPTTAIPTHTPTTEMPTETPTEIPPEPLTTDPPTETPTTATPTDVDRRRALAVEEKTAAACPPWNPVSSKHSGSYEVCADPTVRLEIKDFRLVSAEAPRDITIENVGAAEDGRALDLEVVRAGATSYELVFVDRECRGPAHLKEFSLTFFLTEDATELCLEDSGFHSFVVDDDTAVDVAAQATACNGRPGASHVFVIGAEDYSDRDRRRAVAVGYEAYATRVALNAQGVVLLEGGSVDVCDDEIDPDLEAQDEAIAENASIMHRLTGWF